MTQISIESDWTELAVPQEMIALITPFHLNKMRHPTPQI